MGKKWVGYKGAVDMGMEKKGVPYKAREKKETRQNNTGGIHSEFIYI